ncbi:MAG: hypothetical protein ACM3MK_00745 [Chitinophagales bacterium]
MINRLLMFARDPGGANVIFPLADAFSNRGYEVVLRGKDIALNRFRAQGLGGSDLASVPDDINLDNITSWIKQARPQAVITGTSADDPTEKYIWKACMHLGIPSFAVLDQWMNFGIRFSPYGLAQAVQYKQRKEHPFLPTMILAMDENARQGLMADGIDADRIAVVGHPYLEWLARKSREMLNEGVNQRVRSTLRVDPDEMLITFASEPLSRDYGGEERAREYWGFTEDTIIRELVEALSGDGVEARKRIKFVVKLHPREERSKYAYINQDNCGLEPIIIGDEIPAVDLITASDYIIGMSSMFLLEAVVIGKPVTSIMIGLQRENPFILDRLGILTSIRTKEDLRKTINSIISLEGFPVIDIRVAEGAADNIVKVVEGYICRN